ncbi:MAG: N-acetylneuraminate synthase [Candidatus Yanofskybacteria bacterium]|nr:N-acetylneuraminate synthase [Candidatus Yanofskybacteria bacterium]
METIKIGNKEVGFNKPVFVIAEAGVNHNGSIELALKLIDVAKNSGADAVKFETFKAEQVALASVPMAAYQIKNIGKIESQVAMLKKLELNEKFYQPIMAHCKKIGIIFLSTPHGGFESVGFLNDLGVPAFKFGSGDLTNLPVLEYAAKIGKPMIISTGMATTEEVKRAVSHIKKTGNNKIILLHCTTEYPCPPENVNLRAMAALKEKFGVLVGYSDHTLGINVPIMAATLGAVLIEKHMTLDKNMPGPDHNASVESEELRQMISAIKNTGAILGSRVKKPTPEELSLRNIARKSIVSIKDTKRGELFTANNIGIKRPGTGLEPKYYFKVLGSKAVKDIKADVLISKNDFKK